MFSRRETRIGRSCGCASANVVLPQWTSYLTPTWTPSITCCSLAAGGLSPPAATGNPRPWAWWWWLWWWGGGGRAAAGRVSRVLFLSRDCGGAESVCEDQSSIMYAWGRNAPSTKLPRGTRDPPAELFPLPTSASKLPSLTRCWLFGGQKLQNASLGSADPLRRCEGV